MLFSFFLYIVFQGAHIRDRSDTLRSLTLYDRFLGGFIATAVSVNKRESKSAAEYDTDGPTHYHYDAKVPRQKDYRMCVRVAFPSKV